MNPMQSGGMHAARLTAVSFVLVMLDGYDMLIMSFLAPLVGEELRLDARQLGTLFAAGLAGSMLGSALFGAIADRFGRRPILVGSVAAAGLATIACSQAADSQTFVLMRFLSGVALGGALASVIPLAAESFPKERRSAWVTAMFVGYPLGAVVGGALTAAFLDFGWRHLFIGAGVLTLMAAPSGLMFRETLAVGDPHGHTRSTGFFRTLLQPFANGRAAPTLLAAAGIFSLLFVAYLLNSWLPMLSKSAGLGTRTGALSAVVLNLGGVLGALLSIGFVHRFGLLRVMVAMLALGSVVVAMLNTAFASSPLLLSATFIAGALVIGGQLNCPALFVRLYPESTRAAGVGLQLAAGRLGSIAGPLAAGQLLAAHPESPLVFPTAAAVCGFATLCFALVGARSAQA
jgi:AAHS family 4-hydroxybenzoate transporter-like MFS transporter